MTTDQDLDQRVRSILRDALDAERGPDPVWAASPAAQRVVHQERAARQRWPLRLLAVAAVIGAVGGGALLAGALAEPPDGAGVASNGWIALTVSDSDPSGADDEDIWLVALDKEARRVIGSDSDHIRQLCPAFSPDGRSLAYGQVEGRNAALGVADVSDDGRADDRLTIDVGDGLPPPCAVWSPDGDRVAFGVNRTSPVNPETSATGSEVWVVTLADRGITVLRDLLATDLEWSPDGRILAITSGHQARVRGNMLHDGRIYLYEPSLGAMRSLDGTGGAVNLTWSPDGRRIAWAGLTGDSDSSLGLRVIDVETGQQEVLAADYAAVHGIGPAWSPNGETIAYQRCLANPCNGERHKVVLVTPGDPSDDSVGPREVVRTPTFQQAAQGDDLRPYRVTWSPDSQYLLYVAWTGAVDPMVVAVPTDPEMPEVVLSQGEGLVVHDGYDSTTFVPIQTWGRGPSLD